MQFIVIISVANKICPGHLQLKKCAVAQKKVTLFQNDFLEAKVSIKHQLFKIKKISFLDKHFYEFLTLEKSFPIPTFPYLNKYLENK